MKIFIIFLGLSFSLTINSSRIQKSCSIQKYKFKVKGKFKYKSRKFCKEERKGLTLIYSQSCEHNNCALVNNLFKEKSLKDKRSLESKEFGSPHFLKCRKLEGTPINVRFHPNFYRDKTMLCISKIDNSILNTDALYKWPSLAREKTLKKYHKLRNTK